MKKLYCYLIIFSLLLQGLTVSAAIGAYDADTYFEYAGLISALDISNGFSDPQTDKTSGIQRAEFLNAVMRTAYGNIGNLSSANAEKNATAAPFSDVQAEHWAAYNIEAALKQGIISRADDGLFRPNDKITYNEAVTMAVRALGYTVAAEERGGYPAGYIGRAVSLKLLKGISADASSNFSKADAATLIYNMLFAKPVVNSANNKYTEKYDGDVLSNVHSVVKDTGIFTVGYTFSINGSQTMEKGYAIINDSDGNDVKFRYDGEEYPGCEVNFYYRNTSVSGYAEIIFMYPTTSNNVLDVDGNFIDEYKVDKKQLMYYENIVVSRRESENISHKANISSNINILVNGALTNDYQSVYDLINYKSPAKYQNLNIANIRLVDNNSDGKYDIMLVNTYLPIRIKSMNSTGTSISGYGKSINLDDYNDYVIYSPSGIKMTAKELKVNSVISVVENTAENYAEIYVSDTVLEGKISSVENKGGIIKVTAMAREYNTAKSADEKISAANLDDTYSIYIDSFGRIADIDTSTSYYKTGFVVDTGISRGINARQQLKILEESGDITVYPCRNNYFVDGVSKNLQSFDGSSLNRTLIRYKVNYMNEIYDIDTPLLQPDTNEFSYTSMGPNKSEKLRYKNETKIFVSASSGSTKTVCISNNTVIFKVPSDEITSGVDDMCSVKKITQIGKAYLNDDDRIVEGYITDKGHLVSEYLVEYSAGGEEIAFDSGIIAVNSIGQKRNNRDTVCTVVHGMSSSGTAVSICSSNPNFQDASGNVIIPKKGDVMRYALDAYGDCATAEITFSAGNIDSFTPIGETYMFGERMIVGTAIDKDINSRIVSVMRGSFDGTIDYSKIEYFYLGVNRAKVLIYEEQGKDGKMWRFGSFEDVVTYADDSQKASTVLCVSRSGQPWYMFVFVN